MDMLFGGVLKAGGGSGVSLVDVRGLAGQELLLADDFRLTLVADVFDLVTGVELKPGEETPVDVPLPELRQNANVSSILATLTVRAATTTAPPETTSVAVTTGSGAGATQSFGVSVIPPTLPRNVQVRLEGGEPFWTHGGTLQADDHRLEKFENHVNTYLDQTKPDDGKTFLRFLVKSDTPGNVSIAVASVDYTLLQTETWPNPLDGSLRIDRNLELEFGTQSRIELGSLHDAPGERMGLAQVTLDVSGELGPERVLGDVPSGDPGHALKLSGDYAVGQQVRLVSEEQLDPEQRPGLGFQPGDKLRIAGVTAALRTQEECELYVELQDDAAGRPKTGAPLASRTLTVAPAEGDAGWAFAGFDEAAEIEVDRDYWIVFRGIRGVARLALASTGGEYLTEVRVNRGGQLWKPVRRPPADGVATLTRLVYMPDPDNESAALELGLEGSADPLAAEPAPTVQRLTLAAPALDGPAALVLRSHARGTLTLANVVQEFGVEEEDGR
jgi:hypothetical protein